ncbi:hypothetical protein ACFLZG_01415 [Thermodesulfobacteriota bacterium]
MGKPVEDPGLSGVNLRPIGPTARRERTGFARKEFRKSPLAVKFPHEVSFPEVTLIVTLVQSLVNLNFGTLSEWERGSMQYKWAVMKNASGHNLFNVFEYVMSNN